MLTTTQASLINSPGMDDFFNDIKLRYSHRFSQNSKNQISDTKTIPQNDFNLHNSSPTIHTSEMPQTIIKINQYYFHFISMNLQYLINKIIIFRWHILPDSTEETPEQSPISQIYNQFSLQLFIPVCISWQTDLTNPPLETTIDVS